MKKGLSGRFIAVLLSFCLAVVCFYAPAVQAATVWGIIQGENGTATRIRSSPVSGRVLGSETYAKLEILGSEQGSDGYEWKKVNYKGQIGYVRADLLTVYVEEDDGSFEEQLSKFPESYRDSLRTLHSLHPNWAFQADNLSMTFAEAVAAESANWETKLVPSYYGNSYKSMAEGAYNWSDGTWNTASGNWVAASRETIAYYLDPRNFLNDTGVYQFVEQSYTRGVQTEEGLKTVCKGTFLANGFSDTGDYGGSYYKIIMAAAEQSGVNPYVIAALIILEQGVNGSSSLISGEYGCYNFFNYGATGSDVIGNGVATARREGWTTRSASIIGGAKKNAAGYISVGQDTYYYMDFNMEFDNVKKIFYSTHQYAQSIFDANSKGVRLRNAYLSNPDAKLTLKIPVYRDMPATASPQISSSGSLNNYYFTSLSVSGFSMYTQKYSFSVSGNTNIDYSVPSGASYAGEASFTLHAGQNTVVLPVCSQTGFTNDYILNITSAADCTLTVGGSAPTPTPGIKRGDTNGDGKITIVDLANVQKHLLGIITLTGDYFTAADTNGDGKITIVDLANIQKHLLNIISLD